MTCRFSKINCLLFAGVLSISFATNSFSQDIRGYFFNGYYNQLRSKVATLECFIPQSNARAREIEQYEMSDDLNTLKRSFGLVVSTGGWPEWKLMSETVYDLSYTKDAIFSISQTSRSVLGRKVTTIHDIRTLLALPLEAGPRCWEEHEDGIKYDCKAEWTYLTDTDSFCEEVIKVSKTERKTGFTECSYWAYNLGKIWETTTTDKTRTFSRRDAFQEFKEIPIEEYNKIKTVEQFCKDRQTIVRSYRNDKPEAYAFLQDELAKYVLSLNFDELVYYAGKHKKSDDWAYWLSDGKDWPKFQIKYTFDISVIDRHIKCEKSSMTTLQDEEEFHVQNESPSEIHLTIALSEIGKNSVMTPAFEVEPTTNYTYFFDMKDSFEEIVNIQSYRFKIKKNKDACEALTGDMAVWTKITEGFQEKLIKLLENRKTAIIRIIKFACGAHERYALVAKSSIIGYQQELIRCTLYNSDQMPSPKEDTNHRIF